MPFTPTPAQARQDRSFAKRTLIRAYYMGQMALSNFLKGRSLGLIPVLLVVIFGLLIANHLYPWSESVGRTKLLTGTGFFMIALAIAFNQFSIASIVGRSLTTDERTLLQLAQSATVAFGVAIVLRRWLLSLASGLTRHAGFDGQPHPVSSGITVLASIVIPTWAVFTVLAHFERFLYGFWVLQLALIATGLIYLPKYFGMARRVRTASVVLAVLLVIPNSSAVNVVRSWSTDGYAGKASDEILAVDAIAERARELGLTEPAIGYFFYFGNGYELNWGLQDPRFGGFGSALYQYLQLQHKLGGQPPPPEGFSADDDFRIVQTRPEQAIFPHRFVMNDFGQYQTIGRIGLYDILERVPGHDI